MADYSDEWALACAQISEAALALGPDVLSNSLGQIAGLSLANQWIEADHSAGTATARHYAMVTMADGRILSGRLTDTLVLREGEWKGLERSFNPDFLISIGGQRS